MSVAAAHTPRVWILSGIFGFEQGATGGYIEGIANALSTEFEVTIIIPRQVSPLVLEKARNASWRMFELPVAFSRSRNIAARFLFACAVTFWFLLLGLTRCKKGEIVLAVTYPPILPWASFGIRTFKRTKTVVLVHDVYPDVLAASGFMNRSSLLYRLLDELNAWMLASNDATIAIGRDMLRLLKQKGSGLRDNTVLLSNWSDVDPGKIVAPNQSSVLLELNLKDKFVIQYAGTMGYTHDVELLGRVAEQLRENERIHFLFIGSGTKKKALEEFRRERNLRNMTIVPYFPHDRLVDVLSACHVSIFSFVRGMGGVSVPSRMYNVFAAGRPIIAVSERDSELGLLLSDHGLGWVVKPGDTDGCVNAVLEAEQNVEQVSEMGRRAQRVVARFYTRELVANRYRQLLHHVAGRMGKQSTIDSSSFDAGTGRP